MELELIHFTIEDILMSNMQKNRCSTLFVSGEVNSKATVRYHR